MKRAQCLISKDNLILMVKQEEPDFEIWLLPGGRIEPKESPEEAALRELNEECMVRGNIKRLVSVNDYNDKYQEFTFIMDIGEQTPKLGLDPEFPGNRQNIEGIDWKNPLHLAEREEILLWAGGLMSIDPEMDEW